MSFDVTKPSLADRETARLNFLESADRVEHFQRYTSEAGWEHIEWCIYRNGKMHLGKTLRDAIDAGMKSDER